MSDVGNILIALLNISQQTNYVGIDVDMEHGDGKSVRVTFQSRDGLSDKTFTGKTLEKVYGRAKAELV